MAEINKYISVNILILSHNRAKSICKLINHFYKLICPSNVQFSISIIDDKSTEDNVYLIKEIQKKHSNLYLFENKENKGTFYNRWFLLTKATADYVFFIDDDDDVSDNLFIEFGKQPNIDLIRTVRRFIEGDHTYIKFESLYSTLKKPVDLLYKMNLGYITGIFISKFVYRKVLDVLKQINVNEIHLNILEDTFYFYLIVNFCRSFIFIHSYYEYFLAATGLTVSTEKKDTNIDALKIWNLLTKVTLILQKENVYYIPISFTKINLWYLMWVGCKKEEIKPLFRLIKAVDLKPVALTNFKNKLKCFLLKHWITYWMLSFLIRPFLRIK